MPGEPAGGASDGSRRSGRGGPWRILAAYLVAVVTLVCLNVLALAVLHDLYSDYPEADIVLGLPGLIAGGLANSAALLLTVLVVARPLGPESLRLRPGRETGWVLGLMIVGTLALSQMLDSLVWFSGVDERGSLAMIRRALEGAAGSDLFVAVVVIGPIAGAAEEVFFRGYMQSALARVWPAWLAVVVTAGAFGLLHFDWIQSPLTFLLGLWLGAITERAGSALPAVAAHVINNMVFTVLTAVGGIVQGVAPVLVTGVVAAGVVTGCALALRRE